MNNQSVYVPVLTVAGSDSSGGAGIQADIKTISALGCYAASAITSITVQNTMGVTAVEAISPDIVAGQIRAVMDDIRPQAVKIGMVNDAPTIRAIASALREYDIRNIVIDPVMVSTSGSRLMQDDALGVFCEELLPMATLLTPNIPEAEVLRGIFPSNSPKGGESVCPDASGDEDILWYSGVPVDSDSLWCSEVSRCSGGFINEDIYKSKGLDLWASEYVINMSLRGACRLNVTHPVGAASPRLGEPDGAAASPAILIKGGHIAGRKTDRLFYMENGKVVVREYTCDDILTRNTHGTGCTLSSAIASFLALGNSLPEAVGLAKSYVTEALRAGADVRVGCGHGPVNHFFDPKKLMKI